MQDLPLDLVAIADDGSRIRVQFPSSTTCTVTSLHPDEHGVIRPEVKFGSWSTNDDGLQLVIDGQTADYLWQPDGAILVDEQEHHMPQLVPRFEAAIGLLPASPMFNETALQAALAEATPPRPRGPIGWTVYGLVRLLMPLPWWLRAPLATAVILVLIVIVRLAFHVTSFAQLEGAATTLASVAVAGLVGGGVPTLLFVPMRRLGYLGSLLNGLIATYFYLFACGWAFGEQPTDTRAWLIWLGVGGFFGLVVGHAIMHPLAVAAAERNGTRAHAR